MIKNDNHLILLQYSVAVAARTIDDALGRLSQRVAVKVVHHHYRYPHHHYQYSYHHHYQHHYHHQYSHRGSQSRWLIIIMDTRSYAALRAADLNWIVRPGYNSG